METDIDFDQAIDDAVITMSNQFGFFPNKSQICNQAEYVHATSSCISAERNEKFQHSSSPAASQYHVPLSKEGEKCLAQTFLRQDYDMMHQMLNEGVCKSSLCEKGMQHILARRSDILNF